MAIRFDNIEAINLLNNQGEQTIALTNDQGIIVSGNVAMATGNATGKFAVMSTGVHSSYDFYNNGTSYFNGGVVVDAGLSQTGGADVTFTGIVGVGSTGVYAGTNAALNLPGKGIALKNDKAGSNNNWSYINNTATSGQSNINFATGQASAALTLAHSGNATFAGDVTVNGNVQLGNALSVGSASSRFIWNSGDVSVTGEGTDNGVEIDWKTGTHVIPSLAYAFRVKLVTTGTGTDSGASYVVYYNNTSSSWVVRYITLAGTSSNHPLLSMKTESGVGTYMIAYHNHSSTYSIRYWIETFDSGDQDMDGHTFGSDFQWQRDNDTLTYADGNVQLPDNNQLRLGAGNDLRLYHNGTDSFIDDAGTGDLRIRSNFLKIEKYTGETMATFNDDNAVSLYYDNNTRLETSSSGVNVTGNLTVSDVRTGSSGGLNLGDDSSILSIGRGNEMWTQNDVNDAATLYVNYRGYNGGSTQFRSLDIRDGKAGQIASFNGSDKSVSFAGAVSTGGYLTLNSSDDIPRLIFNGSGDDFMFSNTANYFGLYNNTDSRWDIQVDGAGTATFAGTINSGTITSTGIVKAATTFQSTAGSMSFYVPNVGQALEIAQNTGNATFAGSITTGGDITATGADFTLAHAAGATVYLRRDDTSISDGNVLGLINFQGDDPTNGTFNTGVALMGRAAGDWASGSYESEFILQTRNTSGGLVTALTVNEAQNATFAGDVNVNTAATNGAAIRLIHPGSSENPEIRIQSAESGTTAFSIYNTATDPDAEQFFINNTLGSSHLGNKRGALKLESSSGVVLTLSGTAATFAGTIGATNFSGSSSGTNTGDQDLSGYLTSVPSEYLTQTEGDARYVSFENANRAVPSTGGWRKLLKIGRGGARVAISYTGGDFTPTTYVVDAYKDWSSTGTLSVQVFGQAAWINGFRIIQEAGGGNGDYYLQANFKNISNSHSFECYYQELIGYDSISEIFAVSSGSTLPASNSSGKTAIESINVTDNQEGSYVKNLDVSGRLYLDTVDTSTALTDALVLTSGGEVEKRTLGSNAFNSTTYITSQRAISSTPTDGATTTAISSDWAFDNVKTAVPANALFTDANTTYSAGSGLDLTGTTFSVETDLRDGITHVGKDTSNFIQFDSTEETITFIVGGNAVAVMQSDGDLHIKGDVIAFSDIFNP